MYNYYRVIYEVSHLSIPSNIFAVYGDMKKFNECDLVINIVV